MKKWMLIFTELVLGTVLVLNVSGCSLFYGPSDEEVIKAVTDTGLFSGGEEKFTLQSPMVVVDKSVFSSSGAWKVKVKVHATFMMAGGRQTKPVEKIQPYLLSKDTDSTGNTVWKATPQNR